jgi:hypothetical protein
LVAERSKPPADRLRYVGPTAQGMSSVQVVMDLRDFTHVQVAVASLLGAGPKQI